MPLRTDRVVVRYEITFEAPFHCGTGLPRRLVDRSVQRDATGYLFVPGSTIKGLVREACEQIVRLFGVESASPHDEQAAIREFEGTHWLSCLFGSRLHPGTLCFDDALLVAEDRAFFGGAGGGTYLSQQVSERTQVSLSRLTRTAKPGLLFSSEFGVPGLRFAGEIAGTITDFAMEDAPDTTYALVLLVAGLLSVDHVGSSRSRGAGRCQIRTTAIQVNGRDVEAKDCLQWLEQLEYLTYACEGGGVWCTS